MQVKGTLCPKWTTTVTVPMPSELSKLEALSSQLIQCAKYHQTWYISTVLKWPIQSALTQLISSQSCISFLPNNCTCINKSLKLDQPLPTHYDYSMLVDSSLPNLTYSSPHILEMTYINFKMGGNRCNSPTAQHTNCTTQWWLLWWQTSKTKEFNFSFADSWNNFYSQDRIHLHMRPEIAYLDDVIQESLRLYPLAPRYMF